MVFAFHHLVKIRVNFNTKLSSGQKIPTQEEKKISLEVANITKKQKEKKREREN